MCSRRILRLQRSFLSLIPNIPTIDVGVRRVLGDAALAPLNRGWCRCPLVLVAADVRRRSARVGVDGGGKKETRCTHCWRRESAGADRAAPAGREFSSQFLCTSRSLLLLLSAPRPPLVSLSLFLPSPLTLYTLSSLHPSLFGRALQPLSAHPPAVVALTCWFASMCASRRSRNREFMGLTDHRGSRGGRLPAPVDLLEFLLLLSPRRFRTTDRNSFPPAIRRSQRASSAAVQRPCLLKECPPKAWEPPAGVRSPGIRGTSLGGGEATAVISELGRIVNTCVRTQRQRDHSW